MRHLIKFGSYIIKKVNRAREINFIVMHGADYLFTLVPGYDGFELSARDIGLDVEADQQLINRIAKYILDLED